MAVGDYDGDGQLDVAAIYLTPEGLVLSIYKVDPKTLAISRASRTVLDIPSQDLHPVRQISIAAGHFTAAPHDQLVLTYFTDEAYYPGSNGVKLVAIDFDASSQPQLGPILDSRTTPNNEKTVVKVQTGRFDWNSPYDQVAVMVAWWGEAQEEGKGQNTKWLEVDTVDPKDLSIKRNKLWEFSSQDCGFDFTVGNFDRMRPKTGSPQEMERNPDLQLALVYGYCGDGFKGVQLYSVDPQNGFELSHASTNVELPGAVEHNSGDFRITAGDIQGRSLYLGAPTKIVLDGTAQPTVVTAAPPMHVDFMTPVTATTPEVLNLSVVPDGFFTTYDTDETSTTQSSTTNTSSWSFNSKETVGASVEFGSVEDGEGTEFSDTFTAAQDLKRSTENENESFSTHSFDISQQTGFADQIWYTQTRFNIWTYPVIGRTVCPAGKPNCQDGEKVPMYIQFSGPDQTSYETVAGSQIEWYQPPWEYGNILSYPGSYSQLQKIVPDINLLSPGPDGGALSWLTDGSSLTEKTAWTVGSGTSKSSSSENNYTFNNNTSVTAKGDAGVATVGFNASLDLGGSTGFSNLTKSSTQLGKSTGIAIKKPPFPDPGSYGYWVTPFIYGNQKPGGLVDDQSLSTDVQTFGLLQTAFAVDPTRNDAGGWWKQTYATAPDVALNHPSRWLIRTPGLSDPVPPNCLATGTGASQMNCVELAPSQPANPWISEFHHMRGFFISKATHPGQGPQIESATAGDELTLQARVHNYSFAQMDPDSKVHVRFYGMTWNNSNNKPDGDSFLIGEDVLGPVPPFSSDPDADLNHVYAKTNFDTTPYQDKYLVFWVVAWAEKADGTLATEIANHGLTAIPGAAKSLGDIQSETYSNNVGFYKMPFYVFAPSSSQVTGIEQPISNTVRSGPVSVSAKMVERGQPAEVSIQLRAWAKGAAGVGVVFYDGDPQNGGKAFDVERIPYISPRRSHEVRVPFRSNTCGEHRIFVTVGRGKPFEATAQAPALNVVCEEAPAPPFRLDRKLSAGEGRGGRAEHTKASRPDEAAGGVTARQKLHRAQD